VAWPGEDGCQPIARVASCTRVAHHGVVKEPDRLVACGCEEALLDFAGCAVVISHDRWFLDRIATHILAFEGNSEVVWHEGNYQSYIEDLKKRKGPDADQPHRDAYKKLVRA